VTNVKVCGITNFEDGWLSLDLGADMLGFNFYTKSPRHVSLPSARDIIAALETDSLIVGVFVDESIERILEVAAVANLGAIQLHGDESPQFVDALRDRTDCKIVKALQVTADFGSEDAVGYDADAILLDAYSPHDRGGTGQTFDWDVAKLAATVVGELWLAGGLGPDNVRSAIANVKPYAVDACSSLESAPGVKDPEKLKRFITEAKRND
jgi:phosphoribosylanthranilate isomerase